MTEPTASQRDWIPSVPYKPDFESADGMLLWLAARIQNAERSVPPGDGQGILQQILDTELPTIRAKLAVAVAALEAIRDRHEGYSSSGYPNCVLCELDGPCAVVQAAVLALDALKGGE